MTSLKHSLILFLAFLIITSPVEAKKKTKAPSIFYGIVQSCYDGDTCRVQIANKAQKVRLSGIDAPELKQTFGKEARDHLKNLILKKEVRLECQGESWDRKTCLIFHNDQNINSIMVADGFAWDSPQYSQKAYADLMLKAKVNQKGLWSQKQNILSPYCYRKPKSKKCLKNRLAMSANDP